MKDARRCAWLGELDSAEEESDEISDEFEFSHEIVDARGRRLIRGRNYTGFFGEEGTSSSSNNGSSSSSSGSSNGAGDANGEDAGSMSQI